MTWLLPLSLHQVNNVISTRLAHGFVCGLRRLRPRATWRSREAGCSLRGDRALDRLYLQDRVALLGFDPGLASWPEPFHLYVLGSCPSISLTA